MCENDPFFSGAFCAGLIEARISGFRVSIGQIALRSFPALFCAGLIEVLMRSGCTTLRPARVFPALFAPASLKFFGESVDAAL